MYTFSKVELSTRNGFLYKIQHKDIPLKYRDFIEHLIHHAKFRHFYSELLINASLEAFFWEHKAMTLDHLEDEYEFVLINSPMLARASPTPGDFSAYYASSSSVVTFHNLGKDAKLVVPCPPKEGINYAHMAAFLKHSLPAERDTFWNMVGKAYQSELSHQPKWLSTSGLGVFWLHVRIDTRPKYYTYAPYKRTF